MAEPKPTLAESVADMHPEPEPSQVGELIHLEGVDASLANKLRLLNDVCRLALDWLIAVNEHYTGY